MRRFLTLLFAFSILVVLARTAHAQDFTLFTNNLDFSANAGTSPDAQTDTVTNNTANPLQISLSVSTQSGGHWLSASISPNPVDGNFGTGTITVSVSSSNLQPMQNPYQGTITVSDGNSASDMVIQVTLTVSGVTISAPSSKNVNLVLGATATLSIPVTGGPVTVQIQSTVGWLIPDSTVDAPGNFSVTVDASQLTVGLHPGVLTLQCAPGGSPCLPVHVTITATVTSPTFLKDNAGPLSFVAYKGRNDPPSQAFQITTNDGSELPFTLSASTGWLMVSSSNSVASSKPVVINVSVIGAQLSAGANSGTITAMASNGSPPVTIQVTAMLSEFSISVTPIPPLLESVPSRQTETVPLQVGTVDGARAAVAFAVQTDSGGNWLKAPSSVTAPALLNFTVDASQLIQGAYSGSLTLSCSDAVCMAVQVAIKLTVTAGAIVPQIKAVVGAGLSVPPVTGISANGLFTAFGTNLAAKGTSRNVVGSDLVNGALPTNLADTCIQGGSDRWRLIYVSDTQINAVANPLSVSGTLPVSVITNCDKSNQITTAPFDVTVAAETPQFLFFVQDPSGHNEVVAVEASSLAKVGPPGLLPGVTTTPARAGDILTAYGVSWGTTKPAAVVGSLAAGAATILGDYSLTIGGVAAEVLYAGLTPHFSGLYQINFTVPAGLSPGNQPIVLTVNGVSTPTGAYLAVK